MPHQVVALGSKAGFDNFGDIMIAFGNHSEQETTRLVEQAEQAQQEYLQLLKFLGKSREYSSRLTSDEFFQEIQKFLAVMKIAVATKKK